MPEATCSIGTVVGSGRTKCGAFRRSASRSRRLSRTSESRRSRDSASRRGSSATAPPLQPEQKSPHLDEEHAQALQRQVAEDADAVDAAAHDDDVGFAVGGDPAESLLPSWACLSLRGAALRWSRRS
jgi:hypothetical protein